MIPQGVDGCTLPDRVLDQYELAQKPVHFGESLSSTAALQSSAGSVTSGEGSNNWAISPTKSATGRPILANDPHRSLDVPSLRYIAHLHAPGLNVIGAGEPAIPGIAIGHNEHIGFGITIFFIAQEDLYVYETNPQNPDQYCYRDGWESMRVLHEPIAVRGSAAIQATLKFTRHGPVVFEDAAHHRAYAVRVTWLETGGAPYLGSMRYQRASDVKQFTAALKFWGEPGENQVYADTAGHIGWFPAGFTPIRPNSDGLLPLPGDGRYEWGGFLDRDLLPSEVDPTRGYIATANHMDLPNDYPYAERRIGFSWVDPTRFERISQVLQERSKITLEDSKALQNDVVNRQALHLIRLLGAIDTPDPKLEDTIRWLKGWDGRVTVQSPQAALFEIWISQFLVSAALEKATPALPQNLQTFRASAVPPSVMDLLEHPDARLGEAPDKARDELMMQSLSAALESAGQRLGADRSNWQWGALASILFEHSMAPLADAALRGKLNVGPAAKAGDGSTVNLALYRAQDFRTLAGPSFRMVLDVGQWDRSVAVNSPGQSGDLSSPHYRDLFPLWLRGEYFPLLYSRSAVERNLEHTIFLEPGP